MTLLVPLAALFGAALFALALATDERRRNAPSLPPAGRLLPPLPPVTAIVPVRDEEEHVLGCVASLLAQEPPLAAVRVVDDGSTDRTAELVRSLAASEPRLELVEAGDLPAGWRGKVHALDVGAGAVTTPWILTTDADARLRPVAVARALTAALKGRLQLVSVAGFEEARGPGENLLAPPVFGLLDALLGDWRQAAESTGAPVANGQFLLLHRETWEECGGFGSVRAAAMDDVAVAVRLRGHGHRTGFFRAPEILSVRMYRGLGETWRGWRRNLAAFLGSPGRTAGLGLLAAAVPAFLLLALAAGLWVEALLLYLGGAAASMVLRAGSGNPPLYGLLYPADALLLAAALLAGAWDRKRGRLARWKGRDNPVVLLPGPP